MASAAGCINAQWKGALTFKGRKRRTPCALARLPARSIAALCAGNHGLGWLIVVGELANLALSRFGSKLLGHVLADPQQRRHRPLPYRYGGLHGLAAHLQKPGGVGQA